MGVYLFVYGLYIVATFIAENMDKKLEESKKNEELEG